MVKVGDSTPWGTASDVQQLAEGIWLVTTDESEGLKLSPERVQRLPPEARLEDGWYEDDVDWSIPVLAFATEFIAERVESAERMCRNYRPTAYQAITGKTLNVSESQRLQEETWKAEHADRLLATGCCPPGGFGCTRENVVLVCASLGGDMNVTAPHRYFLIDSEEYRNWTRNNVGSFVVDPDRHEEVEFGHSTRIYPKGRAKDRLASKEARAMFETAEETLASIPNEQLIEELERRGSVILLQTSVDRIAEMTGADAETVRQRLSDIQDAIIDSAAADAVDEVCSSVLRDEADELDFS